MCLRDDIALYRSRMTAKVALLRDHDDPVNAATIWSDINGIVHKLQSLIESEQSRLLKMQQTVNAEQLAVLINVVVDCIKKRAGQHNVPNKFLSDLIADFRGLMVGTTRGSA